jgi:hypothetical protein
LTLIGVEARCVCELLAESSFSAACGSLVRAAASRMISHHFNLAFFLNVPREFIYET